MRQKKSDGLNGRLIFPALGVLAAAVLLAFTGITAARYVLQQKQSTVAETAEFYFNSDLLKEWKTGAEAVVYYMDPAASGFEIKLFNYADSMRKSTVDISYTVSAEGGGHATADKGDIKTAENENTIEISMDGTGADIAVTVASDAPYKKELKAIFRPGMGNQYTVNDAVGNTAAVLTMICADDSRTITLKLPANVIPDATDSRITVGSGNYSFASPGRGVYSVVLFKSVPTDSLSCSDTTFADSVDLTKQQ